MTSIFDRTNVRDVSIGKLLKIWLRILEVEYFRFLFLQKFVQSLLTFHRIVDRYSMEEEICIQLKLFQLTDKESNWKFRYQGRDEKELSGLLSR